MAKKWIVSRDGRNLKFKSKTLLNYAMNRWELNKAHSCAFYKAVIALCLGLVNKARFLF